MKQSDFKVKTGSAGVCLAELVVEISEERLELEMQRAAARIAKEVKVPGFRKGKVPYNIIVQRYGEDTVRQEAVDELAEQAYRDALEHAEIDPYGPDRDALEHAEIDPYGPGTLVETERDPLRFRYTVPLVPSADLRKYRSLRVKPPKVRVEKKEIADALESLRQEHAILEPIEDRAAEPGDVLYVGIKGRLDSGTVLLDEDKIRMLLDPESALPVPGFHEALVGMASGEERTFRLEIPEGEQPEEAEFTVHLQGVNKRILPGLDDDLARTVGNYEGLKELREEVKAQILQKKQQDADEAYVQSVLDKVVEQAKIEYPSVALEDTVDRLIEQFERRIQRDHRMSLPDYLKVIDKDIEQLREEFRPEAEEQLRRSLVLRTVVDVEDLSVEEEEVEERIARLVAALGDAAQELRKQIQSGENRRAMVNDILVERAIGRLVAIARGEDAAKEE